MDFFDLLFGPIGPSLQFIFKIGYIPNENDFLELTKTNMLHISNSVAR